MSLTFIDLESLSLDLAWIPHALTDLMHEPDLVGCKECSLLILRLILNLILVIRTLTIHDNFKTKCSQLAQTTHYPDSIACEKL